MPPPGDQFAVHLGGQALGQQNGRANTAQVVGHLAVQRVDAALASCAPEQFLDAKAQ